MERDFQSKYSLKASRSSYTYTCQCRLQIKIRRDKEDKLHVDKGNNPTGRDNNLNIYTKHWHTQFYTLLDLQEQIDPPNTINTETVSSKFRVWQMCSFCPFYNTELEFLARAIRQEKEMKRVETVEIK
jgi:hypothetical protein